jgi:hypothetical protein
MVVKAQWGNNYQSFLLIVTFIDGGMGDYNEIRYKALGDGMHSVNLI